MNANAASFTPQEMSVEQVAHHVLPDFEGEVMHVACDATTLHVLMRINQSVCVLFVVTNNSHAFVLRRSVLL